MGSPRLRLTKKRGSNVAGRAGDGSRFATARKVRRAQEGEDEKRFVLAMKLF